MSSKTKKIKRFFVFVYLIIPIYIFLINCSFNITIFLVPVIIKICTTNDYAYYKKYEK